jgi:hypothetical protein
MERFWRALLVLVVVLQIGQVKQFFHTPRLMMTHQGGQQQWPAGTLMGKVEVIIYNGILDGYHEGMTFQSTWEAPTIDQAQALGLAERKSLVNLRAVCFDTASFRVHKPTWSGSEHSGVSLIW